MLHLEVVTPIGEVLDAQVDEVVLPGALGELGVLPGHIPLLSAMLPGVLRYLREGSTQRIAVNKGFLEVGAGDHVLVLTDATALPSEIDATAVAQQIEAVEAKLKAWTGPLNAEHQLLEHDLAWARAQQDAVRA